MLTLKRSLASTKCLNSFVLKGRDFPALSFSSSNAPANMRRRLDCFDQGKNAQTIVSTVQATGQFVLCDLLSGHVGFFIGLA